MLYWPVAIFECPYNMIRIHDIIEFYWGYVAPSLDSLADVESFSEITFSPHLRHLLGAERLNEHTMSCVGFPRWNSTLNSFE